MAIIDGKTRRFAANSMFPSFVYAVLGLVLGQVGAAQMHGGWGLRVFLGLPGLVLSGLVLFRARLHWSAVDADAPIGRARALGCYLLLFATGVSFGAVICAGSVLLIGVGAACTYLLPWIKIPVCRARFGMSSAAMFAGAVAFVVIQRSQAQALYFMIAAWLLYFPAVCMHLVVLVSLDRGCPKSNLSVH
jgi:hypothetical protein